MLIGNIMENKKQKMQKFFNHNFFPKNRKAEKDITMPEIMNIVLSIIGILVLIGLVVLLYSNFTNSHRIEQANSSLSKIVSNIETLLENPEQSESNILIESPNEWGIVSWPYGLYEKMPAKCLIDYCICICSDFGDAEDSLEGCNKEGVCAYVSNKTNVIPEPIEIDGPISLNIKLINEEIYIVENKNE